MFYFETPYPQQAERDIHRNFNRCRASEQREFFKVNIDEIYEAFLKYDRHDCAFAMSNQYESELAEAAWLKSKSGGALNFNLGGIYGR